MYIEFFKKAVMGKPDFMDKPRIFVRISTSYWRDDRGLHMKRDINFLKRKCCGPNQLDLDGENMGADDLFEHFKELQTAKDGVYEVIVKFGAPDWETGYVDEWDYYLEKVDG